MTSMAWQADETATNPPYVEMAAGEDLVFGLDATALIPTGANVGQPTSTLHRVDTDAAVVLEDAPTLAANVVRQRLRNLPGGVIYRLRAFLPIDNNIEAMTLHVYVLR